MSRKRPIPLDWLYQGLIVSAIWKAIELVIKRLGRVVLSGALRGLYRGYLSLMFYLYRILFYNASLVILVIRNRLNYKGELPLKLLLMCSVSMAFYGERKNGLAPQVSDSRFYSPSLGIGAFIVEPDSPEFHALLEGRVSD